MSYTNWLHVAFDEAMLHELSHAVTRTVITGWLQCTRLPCARSLPSTCNRVCSDGWGGGEGARSN